MRLTLGQNHRASNMAAENSSLLDRITINPEQCGGRPCIRGKRLRVSDILDLLAAGATYEEILEDYPFLVREDITAALIYAARQTDHVVLKVA
jgi:uncharacterized protein (DUF433 family)